MPWNWHYLYDIKKNFQCSCTKHPVFGAAIKAGLKDIEALVQNRPVHILKRSTTLIPVRNSPVSAGRFSFSAFKAEKHMDRQHPR